MAITAAEYKETKDMVCKHEKWIYGNGEPGAKTELALIKDQLARINKASGFVIAASITLITSVLIWLFTKVLPETLNHISAMVK